MFLTLARRSAAAWACSRPPSARCSPGARPGSTDPVVGVWPCRTKRATEGGVGLVRRGIELRVGEQSQPTLRPMADSLAHLTAEIVDCRACPRLVAWREQVAVEKRASFADETYWGRPVAGFGDPGARLFIV